MKDIIIAPVITEKAANINAEGKTYVFKVKKDANKNQIKEAIESAFNVKVTEIKYIGKTKTYKKAIVTLADGNAIEI